MAKDVDFEVIVEQDEDGVFVADVPRLPGCHSQGRSEAEVMENIREAIRGYLDAFGPPTTRFIGLHRVHVEA